MYHVKVVNYETINFSTYLIITLILMPWILLFFCIKLVKLRIVWFRITYNLYISWQRELTILCLDTWFFFWSCNAPQICHCTCRKKALHKTLLVWLLSHYNEITKYIPPPSSILGEYPACCCDDSRYFF